VPIYDDVRELTAERLIRDGVNPDYITAGFPCQDLSLSGGQAGISEGTRSGLWSEVARLIGELQPRGALLENVSNLIAGDYGRWFGRILGDLAEIGYDAEWHCIPACYVGAWHSRDRVWILAYPNSIDAQGRTKEPILGQSDLSRKLTRGFARWPGRSNLPEPRLCSGNDGIPDRSHRLKAYGNTVCPQIPEIIGRAILSTHQ
jgi:DNA (cytosine-5)-methyltransferase 1